MRILTAKEFLEIKEPVFYQPYFGEFNWGELHLKYDNCGDNDFFYINFMGQDIHTKEVEPQDSGELYDLLSKVSKTKEHFERDYEMTARDGGFDMKQLYVVYDNNDIKQLIKELQAVVHD